MFLFDSTLPDQHKKGIKSVARKIVLGGEDMAFRKPGFAAYRATVDVERMRKDLDVSWILEKPALNIWYGEVKVHRLAVSILIPMTGSGIRDTP
jgi:hypothetical protein